MFYERSELANGVTVVTEHMEGTRSVALGLWVRVGNRDETSTERGLSHLMEHMLFKGTPTRSALDISAQMDALGADMNAFTGRESTCFYARVIDEHFAEAFDVLADMLVNASFAPEELALEREVVIEEIARSEDTPDDHIYDLFSDAIMPTNPLGRPVLGTRELVAGFDHDALVTYHRRHYTTGNVFVVACGNIEHDDVVRRAEAAFSGLPAGTRLVREHVAENAQRHLSVKTQDTEQAHVLYGFPSIARDSPERYAYALLDAIMGGSMSARLFTEIREKRGLAYSVYTSQQGYEDAGVFCMYAGTRPDNIAEVLSVARAQFALMAESGPSEEELARACDMTCGHFVLGMESTRSHMSRLGKAAVSGMPFLSTEETLERYRAVSCADVARVAAHLFNEQATIAIISPLGRDDIEGMLEA